MRYLFISIVLVVIACQAPQKESAAPQAEAAANPTLVLKWETEPTLTTCESVVFDKDQNILYVANINGAPDAKDGNGFISKLSLDGKVTESQWIKGLDAPKGMGVWKGKLFVTDIDKIHEIDIATSKVTKTYPVKDAKFLNDITIDENGKVYASDMGSGEIVLLDKGTISKWMTGLDGPNGLLSEGNMLLLALWNPKTLNTVDVATKQTVLKTDSIENPDGIEPVGDGTYLISSWNGQIHYVNSEWKQTLLLDTRADSVNAADIEYIADQNLLLVPTFFKNTVRAYELKGQNP